MSELTHPAPIKSNMSYMSSKLASYYSKRTWFLLLNLQKVRKTKISLPQCNFIKIHLDLMNIVSQKLIIFDILNIFKLKNHHFLAKWPKCCSKFENLILCFAKLRNFLPNFDFMFRNFEGNFAKFEGNFAKQEIENFAKLRRIENFRNLPTTKGWDYKSKK